jgi:uroporphyrinogen-III decarboxylase
MRAIFEKKEENIMTSRERVIEAINHRTPDKVPVDMGSTVVTSISATAYYNLRKALDLPEQPVKIFEMFQYVARVDDDVRYKMHLDIAPLPYPIDSNGLMYKDLIPFTTPNGIPSLIAKGNEWDVLEDGSVVMYPSGDRGYPPSTKMLTDGMFFDNISERLPDFDEDNLTPREDYKDDFKEIPDEVAKMLESDSKLIYEETEFAIVGQFPGALLGDAGRVPNASLRVPKGIRKLEDYLMAHLLYPEYLQEIYEMQTEIVMKNLEIYKQAVEDRIQVVLMSTADYGNQNSEMISPDIFRRLYMPYYKKMNDWVHKNTNWKVMFHSCGSIVNLLDDYVEMGVDILNPIQLSAAGMDGEMLKKKYGEKLVLWGGGIDTQKTLPFGTPEEVYREAQERLELFSSGGGYVFNPIHNIVGKTPTLNILAMYKAANDFNNGI